MNDNDEWKSFVAIGVMIMLILIGFGGCITLVQKADNEALRIKLGK